MTHPEGHPIPNGFVAAAGKNETHWCNRCHDHVAFKITAATPDGTQRHGSCPSGHTRTFS